MVVMGEGRWLHERKTAGFEQKEKKKKKKKEGR